MTLIFQPGLEPESGPPGLDPGVNEEDMQEAAKLAIRSRMLTEIGSLEYQIAQGRFEAQFEVFAEQVRRLSLSAFPNSSQERTRIEFAVSLLVSNLSHLMERLALDQAKLFDR